MEELLHEEIVRNIISGIQGAALANLDLFTCEIDERVIVYSCTLENRDAATNIKVRIGVVSGGVFYPHKTIAVLAAGISVDIDRYLLVDPRETLRVEITPDGANTDYTATFSGLKYFVGPSRTYQKTKES